MRGYEQGVVALRSLVSNCCQWGIPALTVRASAPHSSCRMCGTRDDDAVRVSGGRDESEIVCLRVGVCKAKSCACVWCGCVYGGT